MEELKELTLEDLRKVTWDYRSENLIGLYKGVHVLGHMFEIVNCSVDRNLLTADSCNVEEGWIEFIECTDLDNSIKDQNGKVILPGRPKIDPDFKIMRTKVTCNMIVNVLDCEGNVIAVLSNHV